MELLWQLRAQRRQSSPELPDTVTRLAAPDGSLLYLVGTAHFSDSSKKDVATVSGLTAGCELCSLPHYTLSKIEWGPKLFQNKWCHVVKVAARSTDDTRQVSGDSLTSILCHTDDPGSAARRGRGGAVPVSSVHVEDG